MITVKEFSLPPVNVREVLRYSGCDKATPEVERLVNECVDETREIFCGKVVKYYILRMEHHWVM